MTSERLIGGEMEIFAADFGRPAGQGAWPSFGKPYSLRCDTGRSALQLALLDWKSRHPASATVWVPSYTCPSVTSAVSQLGLNMRRYADRPGLSAWADPPTPAAHDIVIIIHYFGIANRAALGWVESTVPRSWQLLEDCVQAPYTEAVGVHGEYTVTSLRKWWPAPDGAQVCAGHALDYAHLSAPDEKRVSQRLAAKLLRAQRLAETTYLGWIEESERSLEPIEIRQVSWISSRLLEVAEPAHAAQARRTNWYVLMAGLENHSGVQPLFRELGSGEVPLAFPILIEARLRAELRRFLLGRRIFCPIHWSLPADAPRPDRDLSTRILSIPLDQRYGAEDMQMVLADLNRFFSGSSA
jgi:hypothetical protein